MVIRQVNNSDFQEIFDINIQVQTFPWNRTAIQDELENPNSLGWVAVDQESITGYLFARAIDQGFEIMSLGVEAKLQRRGAAMALMNGACALFKARGAARVILEVSENNLSALTLYKKIGFQIFSTRVGYYSDGSTALCMKLNIANP